MTNMLTLYTVTCVYVGYVDVCTYMYARMYADLIDVIGVMLKRR